MRIAITSTSGVTVDEHFGRTINFMIFDLTAEGIKPVQIRQVPEPLSVGDPGHAFDAERFGKVAATIMDCARVYTVRVGERPAAELQKRGIEPVIYDGAIKDIKL